ncbi:pilus assembly protein TadG-related protein [Paenibacillus xanthanilyticus]|uniref:Pilus assembly protein TadG-related protein n=1 Tax=Paenibacillus xanthanilyticus TaxID=1783531 RepID=A0ABV8K0L4_9BACL
MKTDFGAFIKEERGSTIVWAGLSMMFLLTIAGLVVDGGIMYATKSHLQKTANAAALSGAQELTGQVGAAEAVIGSILAAHGEQSSLTGTEIAPMSTVRVKLEKKIGLGFARLLGKDTATVSAEAAARIAPMGRAAGVAPLGIDESIPLEYLKPYKLKVDNSGVEAGYFGILALGGPGATTYESNLKFGYPSEIEAGDIIDTQTGNVAGKTRDSINLRIDQDPYPVGEYWHRDSSRVILIPVYKPHEFSSNQLKSIEVRGFAYFYILEPMSSKDTSITGMFIERAGTGYAAPDIASKGAYAIRLIE